MCGIIGLVTTQARATLTETVTRGSAALAHRGPDDAGIEILTPPERNWHAAFAQRRLAILDLSSAGHQPMRDERNGNWLTYNGEVFNFHELRATLQAQGDTFHSNSDTEVLLKGLANHGLAAIQQWRGMFALGWWQAAQERLTLVRDRLGIKPLYYFFDGTNFLFASEIRALLATGLVPRRLSRAAVESYLSFGSVQQPLTIIENVYAVLPGHTLTFANGELHSEPYWQLPVSEATAPVVTANEPALIEEIAELLREAVRLRLVSDVPVGVFLSGGIDSSSLVSLLRRATNGTVKTFSLFFKEQDYSERAYADLVARQYGTEHHPLLIAEADVLAQVPRALQALDQPAVDGLNSYIVSESATQAGLKVALSGLGGDEVFAGYDMFRTIAADEARRAWAARLPAPLRTVGALASNAYGALAHDHRAHKLGLLLRSEDLREHAVTLHRRLFTTAQQRQLLAQNGFDRAAAERVTQRWQAWQATQRTRCAVADAINQASLLELGGYLSNTLLRDTDVMSMAHGLEVRVPLIDHVLVERVLRIPGARKVDAHLPKHLLVKAVGDLPQAIIERPKRGFELPFKHWLVGELRPSVEAVFHSPAFAQLFAADECQALWQGFLRGTVTWSRVWSLYVLSEWARLNRVTYG